MIGVCKFCRCTEHHPCLIPAAFISDPDFRANGNVVMCSWLLEDVCDAPACVLKAYLEARPLAESLMSSLGLLESAA